MNQIIKLDILNNDYQICMNISQWKNSELENQGILDLIENAYGTSELKDPKYFNWQYNENPQGNAIIVLCLDEEKENFVIGQESIIPSVLNIDKNQIKASFSLNTIVHTNYRRRGIFSKLVNALPDFAMKEGIVSVYGVPNSNSHKAFLKEGWKEIGQLPFLVRILNPSNYFNNALKIFLRPISYFYKIKNLDKIGVEKYEGNFVEFDQLTSNLPKRIRVSQNRNHRYLQWRYHDHPTRKYDTYIIRKESEIIGYIITRKTKFKGKPIGVILDFVTDGKQKNEKEFVNLAKFALLELQNKNTAVTIATFPPFMLEYKILCKAGFFKIPKFLKPEPLPFIINIFDKNNQELKSIENYNNWFFTFGDYDVF